MNLNDGTKLKKLLFILLCLLNTFNAYSDCESSGIWFFPNSNKINQNSIFIITGYSNSREIILKLNKKYNVYLKSGNKKVNLIIKETCIGQFNLTQAILKPETELETGLEYTLCIDNLPSNEKENFERYNSKTNKYEQKKYKINGIRDAEKPLVASKPKLLKKTFVLYGCGPSIHTVFTNPAKDESEIIVKTTLRNLKTKKETTFYIEPENNKIKVGHDMCSGAFDYGDSMNYEVEFSFMDSSGNITQWTGERIKFTKPTEETDPNDD